MPRSGWITVLVYAFTLRLLIYHVLCHRLRTARLYARVCGYVYRLRAFRLPHLPAVCLPAFRFLVLAPPHAQLLRRLLRGCGCCGLPHVCLVRYNAHRGLPARCRCAPFAAYGWLVYRCPVLPTFCRFVYATRLQLRAFTCYTPHCRRLPAPLVIYTPFTVLPCPGLPTPTRLYVVCWLRLLV